MFFFTSLLEYDRRSPHLKLFAICGLNISNETNMNPCSNKWLKWHMVYFFHKLFSKKFRTTNFSFSWILITFDSSLEQNTGREMSLCYRSLNQLKFAYKWRIRMLQNQVWTFLEVFWSLFADFFRFFMENPFTDCKAHLFFQTQQCNKITKNVYAFYSMSAFVDVVMTGSQQKMFIIHLACRSSFRLSSFT